MRKRTLICVVGPTAIGKTRMAIALAQHYKTAILSADSRQFYREMKIGTAVPETEELRAAPHHFIQHISVDTPYSVGTFEKEALERLEDLFRDNEKVILVGGSGLYVDAVTRGLDVFPKVLPGTREALQEKLEREGLAALQEELRSRDPDHYRTVDLENPHRLIRALEVCRSSGQPYSSFLGKKSGKRNFRSLYVGLDAPREVIYQRINQRVDAMMQKGLLEEARALYDKRHLTALQTVGYKELFRYFDGELSLEEATEEIKKNTRRFAKRQLTWYRKQEDIHWFDHQTNPSDLIAKIEALLDEQH